ncbi:hypothetical protein [Palaeococcus ferrophilus]|uniref:hypothetical protein n=1 Tax=Palaeococcus ferrophilus TaxID=83868 RepID=UPI00064E7F01|nr:hypothetical protein [Palaeococcus ferrophilus]
MTLYEERLSNRLFAAFALPGIISMLFGLAIAYGAGEGVEAMIISLTVLTLILLDVSTIKIQIDEREVRIRGLLGIILRKTVPLEEIEGFSLGRSWTECRGGWHFTLPAEGCVLLVRKRGWSVSFSTNRPHEVSRILETLGVSRV